MGENAKKTWEWHNTVVGEGYQARGVVRQRVSEEPATVKVIDMRGPESKILEKMSRGDDKKVSKHKDKKKKSKSSKHKRRTHSDSESDSENHKSRSGTKKARFNPLLQALSIRLRDNLSTV